MMMTDRDDVANPPMLRKTKIVATLGPSSWEKVDELITAGVNAFRINFSHATHEHTRTLIARIREAEQRLALHSVAILGDLCGPKVRVNAFVDGGGIELRSGTDVTVSWSHEPGRDGVIHVESASIVRALKPGTRLLFDDGTLECVVSTRVSDDECVCRVVTGGMLRANKGMNVPNLILPIQALTAKDRVDAAFILDQHLDYVALSFVQRKQDILDLRQFIDEHKYSDGGDGGGDDGDDGRKRRTPQIIAKIEKPQAIDNLAEIVDAADGIMVARGDLGVECDLTSIPRLQKHIIRVTKSKGKPVITATQMLETMIKSPTPTRAEVSDVACALYDGTDAVMLSGETAAGHYPVEAVTVMGRICLDAEKDLSFQHRVVEDRPHANRNNLAICTAVVSASAAARAPIMVFTKRGHMAMRLSQRKPPRRIIAVTHDQWVARRLALYWAVYAVVIDRPEPHKQTTEDILERAERAVLRTEWLWKGASIVFCSGTHTELPGLNSVLRLTQFGDALAGAEIRARWARAIGGATAKKNRTTTT